MIAYFFLVCVELSTVRAVAARPQDQIYVTGQASYDGVWYLGVL